MIDAFGMCAVLSDDNAVYCFVCDPAGARTQDPNIKSVVLYLLSYRVILTFPLEGGKGG